MGLMAMSASSNGVSCAKSCDVGSRWVSLAGGCSLAINFSQLRAHREVQSYSCCRWDANSFSSFTEDLESWGLKLSRCGRFSRRSKLETMLQWRYGATNSHSRWRSGVTTRCGSAESAGEGRRTSAAVLDVYLIRELLPPLVLGTVAFTVAGVSIGKRRSFDFLSSGANLLVSSESQDDDSRQHGRKISCSFSHIHQSAQFFYCNVSEVLGFWVWGQEQTSIILTPGF